jgi:hypothetical protein
MSVASRPVSTGKTRTCPHCKATILESLSICPGCMHHLRFDSEAAKRQVAAAPALRVEGIIRHPPLEQPLEYFVIIAIRNDRGEEVTRQVVNVGALQAAEKRTFTLSVEVLPPSAPVPPAKSNTSTGTFKSPVQQQPAATVKPPPPPPAAPTPPAGSQGAGNATAGSSSPAAGTTAGATGVAINPPAAAPKAPTTPTPQMQSPRITPPPGPPRQASNPNAPKPPVPGSPPAGSSAPGAAKPATPGAPANPPNPAAPAKPTSGYVLKPPSPGGPKRH